MNYIKSLFFLFFLVGCVEKNEELDIIKVLSLEKRLESLEKRVVENEKSMDSFLTIVKKLEQNDVQSYDIKISAIDNEEYRPKEATKDLEKYLFKTNIYKKVFEFKRESFLLRRSAIIYDEKGKKMAFFPKDTVIESSYRLMKYFKIDSYILDGKLNIPNGKLFISEEAFL